MAIGIYIEYIAFPGRFDELLAQLTAEGEACMRDDEGCLRMELSVPQQQTEPGRVHLSELWRDRAALTAHAQKPGHSHDWQIPLVASKRVAVCDVVSSPPRP